MNYWGACCANLAECCQPLHELIYKLADTGRRTARELYGADGFCAHHNTDIWGLTYPVGGWATETTQFSYFPLAGAWLTSHLYEYYLETKDKDFLAGKAFDAIVGSARFCDSMLSEQDGELIFCPASSPENGYLKNGKKYAIDKSSAMFQTLVREAFEICISACRILGREEKLAAHLEERLSKLRGLRIGSDGRLLEWDCERIENDPHHRHLSHLYCLHPMRAVTDERLLSACKASLDFRGDEGTAWGCIWKACFHATLGDGERAIRLIDAMMAYVDARENFADVKSAGDGDDTSDWGEVWSNKSSGTLPNLMCTCPPFQMDGNYGFVAAVNSMLVGEKGGETVLLPAIPALWKSGEVKGLRVGGRTVSVKWENGRIVSSDIV
jgi:alpha-L-fucosidase 2